MPCLNHPAVDARLAPCTRCNGSFCPNCLVALQGALVCGACKAGTVRDVRAGVATQGLDLATTGRRFGALFVDGICINLVSRILTTGLVLALVGTGLDILAVQAIVLLLVLVLVVAYDAGMVVWRGQTLGKMALKVKVVNPDGSDVSPRQAIFRALVKLIPLLPYLPAFFTKERTGLHDMAAGTRVIRWG